ncbi:MAG: GerMN domain-containing protein [Bacilli bacterium]|mgnify:CR=1 FL=1|nr:GerMN domain-containing protein [Bacilli bacterium]MDD4608506.1 GerMN domain-containing protein [Bacilli bacterium]
MLKRMTMKKILVSTLSLCALFLIYIVPKDETANTDFKQKLEYINEDVISSSIYLMDSNNYLGRASVIVSSSNTQIERRAKELVEILINDGVGENKVPNGFKSLLPSDTKILSIKYEEGLIKINFSKELLDINEELEEKMVEAIVYTLTSIPKVEKVIIYVEGDILSRLPKTKITLPSTLDRSFGINKNYDLSSYQDINQTTIYYVSKHNDNYYYVPVTKYTNDDRDKISIIVDELTSTPIYSSNLMSFLNGNTKLLSVNEINEKLELEFNSYIFDNADEQNILEEVLYTLMLSIKDNYDVKEVVLEVKEDGNYKNVIKTIE